MIARRGVALVVLMAAITVFGVLVAAGLPLILARRTDVERSFLADLARDGAASIVTWVRAQGGAPGGFKVSLSTPTTGAHSTISGTVARGESITVAAEVLVESAQATCRASCAMVLSSDLTLISQTIGVMSCR